MTDTFDEEPTQHTTESLVELVNKKIEETFESGRDFYFLSRLGADLGKPVLQRIEKITGMRLAEFLRVYTPYEPRPSATDEKVFFLQPLAAERGEPIKSGRKTRYVRSFWTAFFKPSMENERRFVNASDGTFRSEFDSEVENDEEAIEIDRDLMPGPNDPDTDDTYQRISVWLVRHNLPSSRFEHSAKETKKIRQTLLDEVLATLSVDQKKRVVLPLDVIDALKGGHGAADN